MVISAVRPAAPLGSPALMAITHAGSSTEAVIAVASEGEGEVFAMNPIGAGWRKNGSLAASLDTIIAFYVKAP